MSRSSMTVLTHPSGEDLVLTALNQVRQSNPSAVLVQHVGLGEFEVHASHSDLAQAELLLKSITGVRCFR
jgi:translation elongation factor EF-1alpha